ncbi:MAG: hypothetical protein MSA57_09385, partial [Ruminococcus sp.]|nr:hypothetical protein [Ruminococcus sp.]
CPVALSEFAALILIIQLCLNLTASKNAIAAGKTDCKIKFASQMWATRPHLASIFKKLLDQKTFVCLRLVLGIPPESGSARLGHIPSLPRESQLPLKPCISLQPSDFEGNCDSLRFSPRFLLHFIVQFHLLRKCGLLAHTSAAFL